MLILMLILVLILIHSWNHCVLRTLHRAGTPTWPPSSTADNDVKGSQQTCSCSRTDLATGARPSSNADVV